MLYIQSINEILNGVESRSTGYQDDRRYWNLNMHFEESYDQKFIARVIEDGDNYVFLADTALAEDHIAFSYLKPEGDNIVEEEFGIDMNSNYSQEELYREVCEAFESLYEDSNPISGEKAVALD